MTPRTRTDPVAYDPREELALDLLRLVRDNVLPPKHPLRSAVAATIRDAGGDVPTAWTPIGLLRRPRGEPEVAVARAIVGALRHLLRGVPDSAEWRLAIAYLRLARLTDREPDLVPAPHRQDLARDFGRRREPAAPSSAPSDEVQP